MGGANRDDVTFVTMLHDEGGWKQVRIPRKWWKILKIRASERETTIGKILIEAVENLYGKDGP
jgi:hypothetical protein